MDFPKANGYRSLHTTVKHESGLMMEIQVRAPVTRQGGHMDMSKVVAIVAVITLCIVPLLPRAPSESYVVITPACTSWRDTSSQ